MKAAKAATKLILRFLVRRFALPRIKLYSEEASKIMQKLGLKSTILDVGGGRGYMASSIASLLGEGSQQPLAAVLDIEEKYLLAGKKSHSSIEFVCGDACHMPFRSQAFQAVLCFSLLEHLTSPKKAVSECCRAAKALVVVQVPNLRYYMEFHTVFPLLHLLPKKLREAVIRARSPGLTLNFTASMENIVRWVREQGLHLLYLRKVYHSKLSKLLVLPQSYIMAFLKPEATLQQKPGHRPQGTWGQIHAQSKLGSMKQYT